MDKTKRMEELLQVIELADEQIATLSSARAEAWELMTEAERHEVISLVVRSVRVKRKDAFDIQLAVPGSNMWEEWLPVSSPIRIDANTVILPGEGASVAEFRLGGER